jgi:pyruvate/2-oxoacid:ferredoxin oxidoreductase alpha subunit
MVCYDGFVLSHASTPVEIPSQEDVDRFLPPYTTGMGVSEGDFMNLNPLILSEPRPDGEGRLRPGYMDLRYRLQEDLVASLETIQATDREFETVFGRGWGGQIWEYRMDDAEHALVSMGSLASEATLAADDMRKHGYRTGVLGVRAYRPFPASALARALSSVETVTVFEKDVSYGYSGALATDLKAAIFDKRLVPRLHSYVAGLGGRDVRPEQLVEAATKVITGAAASGWIDVHG